MLLNLCSVFWRGLLRIKKCHTFRVNRRLKLAAALTRAFKGLAALASLAKSLKVARLGIISNKHRESSAPASAS
eukprot:1158580-Pelagomonas_calceolata.AAC.12